MVDPLKQDERSALLIIDLQNDYFPGGRMELEGADAAAAKAADALHSFRSNGLPVIHVRHISVRPGATYFLPGTAGAEIRAAVLPVEGEAVVEKNFPNSFRSTNLQELLDQNGGHDDAALDHVLDLGGEVVDREQVGDGGEHQHAEQRADDGAAAAAEQCTADDRRGDRVEFVQVRHGGLRTGRLGRQHDRRDTVRRLRRVRGPGAARTVQSLLQSRVIARRCRSDGARQSQNTAER